MVGLRLGLSVRVMVRTRLGLYVRTMVRTRLGLRVRVKARAKAKNVGSPCSRLIKKNPKIPF